jgi:alkanesulfonate monooxygenase SsuD/methylene tetrahydromethanopterin reductase-like flavin-dependent oxidoreductase (luciferase family)
LTFIENCGVMVEPQEGMSAEGVLDAARLAEKAGFGFLFRSDHLLPTSRRKGLESPECWTTMGAIAASTTRIKFGTMVSPIGFRNPALLARMANTVNSIAGGRLQLGVGAGWYGEEYHAHGFRFPHLATRKEQFTEALKIIRPLTQVGRVNFDGRYFAAHLDTLPKLKARIHLIIGGRVPSIVRKTAEFGDEWNFFPPIPEKFDALKKHLDDSGRSIPISRMGGFILADSTARLRARLRSGMRKRGVSGNEDAYESSLRKRGVLVGTERDFADGVNKLRERGVERFYFQVWDIKEREEFDLLVSVLKRI